jgi:hypothetical protein
MAWPLPLSWKGREGFRAATSTAKPVEWRVAFSHRLVRYLQGRNEIVHVAKTEGESSPLKPWRAIKPGMRPKFSSSRE